MTALTAGQLADALGCFWNAALQAAHERQEGGAFTSIMAEGIAAVQNRLTEIANANVGIEPTSGQIDLVLLGVDDVVSGRVTDGLDPVRALEAAKDHLKASLISTGFEATIPERGIDACMDAMETQMLKYGSEPTPWRTLSEKEELRDVIRSGLTAFLQSYTKGNFPKRSDPIQVPVTPQPAITDLITAEEAQRDKSGDDTSWHNCAQGLAVRIEAIAPEDAIAEVAELREEVKHKNGVIARLLTEAGHLDHARNNEQAMAVEAASERDRLAAELAAANAREAGLREALDMSHQGWRNALELDLLPKQHRHSAKTMADIAAAALAAAVSAFGEWANLGVAE